MGTDSAIRAEGLGKRYALGQREPYSTLRDTVARLLISPLRHARSWFFPRERHPTAKRTAPNPYLWALKDVSFEVKKGEVLGVIGRNGAGKSTLLKILSRITQPTEGWAEVHGLVRSLLEVGTGFHPELTGRDNIFLNGAILGMKRHEIRKKFDDIVSFAEVERFIDTPVKRYSSGMYVRLAFAVAAHLESQVLLVDEVLAVGDFNFQQKCLGKVKEVTTTRGVTVLLVSHHMHSILNLCTQALLLRDGQVACRGLPSHVVQTYLDTTTEHKGYVSWSDHDYAPGTERIRIHSVRLLNSEGMASAEHDIQKGVTVEIQWWNLCEGLRCYCALNVRDLLGTVVLGTNSMPGANIGIDPWWNEPHPRGLYRTICKIPGNFLNDTRYSIDVVVGTGITQTEVFLENVLSFHTIDTGAMRKEHPGHWHGLVRIPMEWRTEKLTQNPITHPAGVP